MSRKAGCLACLLAWEELGKSHDRQPCCQVVGAGAGAGARSSSFLRVQAKLRMDLCGPSRRPPRGILQVGCRLATKRVLRMQLTASHIAHAANRHGATDRGRTSSPASSHGTWGGKPALDLGGSAAEPDLLAGWRFLSKCKMRCTYLTSMYTLSRAENSVPHLPP